MCTVLTFNVWSTKLFCPTVEALVLLYLYFFLLVGAFIMSSSAAENGTAATASASSSLHITKHNIDSFDYFQLFNLTLPASAATAAAAAEDIDMPTVRRIYRRFSLRFHPDKDDSAEARHAFEVVHSALETIIDPVKRAAYLQRISEKNDSGAGAAVTFDEDQRQRQRTQQAQEEALWAADQLNQREQQRLAKEAAARQAAQEREEAAQRLLSELTSSLNTPFQQMEAELVRDWDVDDEMMQMKLAEVTRLLQQLAPSRRSDGDVERHGVSLRKRSRDTAEMN